MTDDERNDLIVRHLPLVKHVARKGNRRWPGIDHEDAVQEGAVRLLERFGYYRGAEHPFAAFVNLTVPQHLKRQAWLQRVVRLTEPRARTQVESERVARARERMLHPAPVPAEGLAGAAGDKVRKYELDGVTAPRLRRAMLLLRPDQRELLEKHYGIGRPAEPRRQIGRRHANYDRAADAYQMRLSRARGRLKAVLAKLYPGEVAA